MKTTTTTKTNQHPFISGKVKVLWDDGFQETYKFGEEGIYEVHVVDENRYLEPNEDIAVGIHVVRGRTKLVNPYILLFSFNYGCVKVKCQYKGVYYLF